MPAKRCNTPGIRKWDSSIPENEKKKKKKAKCQFGHVFLLLLLLLHSLTEHSGSHSVCKIHIKKIQLYSDIRVPRGERTACVAIVLGSFISISGGCVLLCKELIMAEQNTFFM